MNLRTAIVASFGALVFFLIGFVTAVCDHRHDFDDGVRYGLIAQMDNPRETDLNVLTGQARKWRDLVNRYGSPSPAPR